MPHPAIRFSATYPLAASPPGASATRGASSEVYQVTSVPYMPSSLILLAHFLYVCLQHLPYSLALRMVNEESQEIV